MLHLMSDPKLYLLFVLAYAIGFIDLDGPARLKNYLADASFWSCVVLMALLCVSHGPIGGVLGFAGAWILAMVGARRSVLAQRNALWDTPLWTSSIEVLLAAASARPPMRSRPIVSRGTRTFGSLADLVLSSGQRQTVFGMALDMAACFSIITALAVLLHLGS